MTQKLEKLDRATFYKFESDLENKLEQLVWDLSEKYNAHEFFIIDQIRSDSQNVLKMKKN